MVVNLVVRNVPIITDQLSSVVFYFYVQIKKHSIYALIASGFRYLFFFFNVLKTPIPYYLHAFVSKHQSTCAIIVSKDTRTSLKSNETGLKKNAHLVK